jgi:hypothetical protein
MDSMRGVWPVIVAGLLLMAGCQQVRSDAAAPQAATIPPPPSTTGISKSQHQHFVGLVCTELRYRDLTPVVGSDWVQVEVNRGQPTRFGLRSLLQRCDGLPQDQWPRVISQHFDDLLETLTQQGRIIERMSNFERARERLTVRIYPADSVPSATRKQLVCRTDLPGTVTVLMLDLPKAIQSVSADLAKHWERSERELFETALGNVRRRSEVEVSQSWTAGGAKIVTLRGEDATVSSHVLLLKEHPEAIGKFGAIVAVPTRNQVMCHPIEDSSVGRAGEEMAPMVERARQAGPGGTSAQLYWYHDGRFEQVPTVLRDGAAMVLLPAALTQPLGERPAATASDADPGDR